MPCQAKYSVTHRLAPRNRAGPLGSPVDDSIRGMRRTNKLVLILVSMVLVATSALAANAEPDSQPSQTGSIAALTFEGSGVQTLSQNFANHVVIGDETVPFPARDIVDYTEDSIDIDLEQFPADPLELTIQAGTRPGQTNTDGFTLRDVRLVMPDGREVYAEGTTKDQRYVFRDEGSNNYSFSFQLSDSDPEPTPTPTPRRTRRRSRPRNRRRSQPRLLWETMQWCWVRRRSQWQVRWP